ncbi:MAG: hypothetical protein ABI415_04470 [Flavitalea sp.]
MRYSKWLIALLSATLLVSACQKKDVYYLREVLKNYAKCDVSKLTILAHPAMKGDPQLPNETHIKYYNPDGTVKRIRTMYFGIFGDYKIYDLNITYQGFKAIFKGKVQNYDYTSFLEEENPVNFDAAFDPKTGWVKTINKVNVEYSAGRVIKFGNFNLTYDAKGNLLKMLDKTKSGAIYTYGTKGAGKNLFYAPIRGTNIPDVYWMVDFLGWAPIRSKNERLTFLDADPTYNFDPEKYYTHQYDNKQNLLTYDTEPTTSKYQPKLEWNCDCLRNGAFYK